MLPQHPSFVFVDHVLDITGRERIRTSRAVSAEDPFVQWHFPGGPHLLPGVILIEFASQSAYLLGRLCSGEPRASQTHVLARCSASFRSPALPGDTLTADVRLTDAVGDVTVYDALIHADEREIARIRLFGARRDEAAPIG